MLSRLSADEAVSQESFRGILEYMLGFIEKDKQTEGLIEKLCNRFPQTTGTPGF
jgi:condensin complex subunit 1